MHMLKVHTTAIVILSVRPSVCHHPLPIQAKMRQRLLVFTVW